MQYVYRFLFFCLVVLLLRWGIPTVEAHVLRTDGTIGAVMHIDPDDDPIAGEQSAFFFELKDTSGKFTPADCTCTVQFLENGAVLSEQPLFQNTTTPSLTNASVVFTFPKRDVYTIRLIGKPLTKGDFTPFTLSYDIRVAREAGTKPERNTLTWLSTNLFHVLGAIIIGIFFVFLLLTQYKRQSTKHDQPHHHHTE